MGGGWSYFNTELHLPVCVSISAFSGCDLSDSLSYFIHTCMMFNKKNCKIGESVYNWIKSISKAISILIYTEVHVYPQFMIEEREGWSNESICDTDVRMSDCIQINNQVSLKKVKKKFSY